ncbi:hypothetical protein HYU22_02145 [Candidatus Woesearchaeota archaeon]|nr:hypothetical protein [Candidatus Woesearchaeota archaeon]
MKLPPLPQIPLDLDKDSTSFLESLDGKVDKILVARKEGDTLNVLGKKGRGSACFRNGLLYTNSSDGSLEYVTIEKDLSSARMKEFSSVDPYSWSERERKIARRTLGIGYAIWWPFSNERKQRHEAREIFHYNATQYYQKNLHDIQAKVNCIPILQSSMTEAESILGSPLEYVDTGSMDTFLQASDRLWLRVQAYQLGASAIVHYQPGSAIGTPVRSKKK